MSMSKETRPYNDSIQVQGKPTKKAHAISRLCPDSLL